MQITVVSFILSVIAAATASHFGLSLTGPAAPGAIIQGPSSRAMLAGPDGSHISGIATGGTVVAPAIPGGVVSAAVAPGYVLPQGAIAAPSLGGQHIPDYAGNLYDDGSYTGDC